MSENPASGSAPATLAFDERGFRDALGGFASGITIITTHDGEGPVGVTCQSFFSVSVDPPLVAFSLGRGSRSLAALRASGEVAVNFLSDAQEHLSAQFARSGADKWQGVTWHPAEVNGAPTLDGVPGWVAGRIEQEIEAGDHLIFLVRVQELHTDTARDPLLYSRGRYRRLAP